MKDKFRILVPFDFSRTAENALDYVGSFVKCHESAEVVLGYVQPSPEIKVKEEMLTEVLNGFHKKSRNQISWSFAAGKVKEGMEEIIRTVEPDLIFMGTSSLTEGRRETRAAVLALEARCPVFIIPKDFRSFKLDRIALMIGADPIHDRTLLDGVLMVARSFKATVEVVTVKNGSGQFGYSQSDEANESVISYYLENFYSHHTFLEGEDLGKTLFSYVKRNKIDLMAILPRNHAPEEVRSEGTLTRFLAEHTETPLLVVDL